ncbi:MAG: hypothetical protein V8Q79_11590 [Christensenellales bacterium]
MVISDKQALRRCVKQAVRRAEVVESMLDFDILHGVLGVKPLLSMAVQPFEGTPLGKTPLQHLLRWMHWRCRSAIRLARS